MPQLPQRLRLDLADALAGDAEVASYFFECTRAAIFEAEPHDEYVALALG